MSPYATCLCNEDMDRGASGTIYSLRRIMQLVCAIALHLFSELGQNEFHVQLWANGRCRLTVPSLALPCRFNFGQAGGRRIMSTSMHVCNPYCGKCKPPKEPLLLCPGCGTMNDPTRGDYEHCRRCGTKLPERKLPVPAHCARVDAVCANPCGRKNGSPLSNGERCVYFTPVA